MLEAVDELREVIERVCKADGGQIAGLYRLRILLQSERARVGVLGEGAR